MISKGEASPKRGPERKRTERMANTSNSQLNGVNPPIIYPGSSSPPLPPSTPSAQDIISPASHHPPPPVRFMLLHVHTNPEQDSNAVIRASLSSPSRPPHLTTTNPPKPDQHPIQYLPNGVVVVIPPSSLIVPSIRNPPLKPCPCLTEDPQKECPPPFSREVVVNPSQNPQKPRPNQILTVPNAQSHLQYIDSMHYAPPSHRPPHPLKTARQLLEISPRVRDSLNQV